MIKWIKRLNRSRNHHFKIYKFNIKLKLICMLSHRYTIKMMKRKPTFNNLVIPFIGKGIGDAIVFSGLIDTLIKYNFNVSVIADKKTYFLFNSWQTLSNLFLYTPENENITIAKLKNLGDFVFLDPHEITQSSINTFNIIRKSKPIRTIGFNKGHKIYDHILAITSPAGHISGKCFDIFNFLELPCSKYDYAIRIPEENKIEAYDFTKGLGKKKIISFVPYGSVKSRFFSMNQINSILNYFSERADELHLIIIGEQDKIKTIKSGVNISKNPHPSFFTAAQLIAQSHLVITPDTSFVHLSRIFNKRMLCFYPFKLVNEGADNSIVWGPNYDNAIQIRLTEDHIDMMEINSLIFHIDSQVKEIQKQPLSNIHS